ALMGGVDLGDTINQLSAIHKALKAAHASGELTDQQYTEKARELLGMLGSTAVFIQQNTTESDRRDEIAMGARSKFLA
ncbi:MAG: hypothetical protein WCF34_04550, partial [Pseudolabrys sp.]